VDAIAPACLGDRLYRKREVLRWSASIDRALDHERGTGNSLSDAATGSARPDREGIGAPLAPDKLVASGDPPGAAYPAGGIGAGGNGAGGLGGERQPRRPPQFSDDLWPDGLTPPKLAPGGPWVARGEIDRRSVLTAVLGGAAYLALAGISLLLPGTGDQGSLIWLPNAAATALLLRARISNEIPFLLIAFAASVASNVISGMPDHVAVVFSLAHIAEIIAVLALTRTALRAPPDMSRLSDLVRFVWAGGMVGPALSALLVSPVIGFGPGPAAFDLVAWFVTNSLAMILIVPAALLLLDRIGERQNASLANLLHSLALLAGGMICTFLVFRQSLYPLMFLIPPITLLHAFRLGSLGSALHVVGVAIVAGGMTWAGYGPIAAAAGGTAIGLQVLQAFIAANFLTGLPVSAILAGRDRMLSALEAGKRQLDLLADNITDAILRYDLDGVCTYASPSVREVMGAAPEAYIGQSVAARLHPDSRDRTLQALDRLLDGTSDKERVTYRRFIDHPDGTPVFLEADCAVVMNPETGEREGVVVAARDVTERVELELLLTRARRHAENAAQAKSDFLANMSHEIRTPMNGVLGFAELMLQGKLATDQRRFAELIVQSGRSMMMLLNDVLDLSKIESGQFAIDRAPVDLHASLAECAALHRPAAEAKGVSLVFAANDAKPHRTWVMTDGLRVRQIMLNLIGNAVKFTEAGQIEVAYQITPQAVCVTVADTGIGISPSRLDSIFLPFTQGEAETARRFGGTGLGLSISRQLASLLGGRIEVESTPGAGSRFTLVLPATLVQPATAVDLPEPLTGSELPHHSRILLVEDHDINRELVCEMLERCGQDVAVAHDGNEGIAMVIASIMRGRPYDLVLMDVQMPDCDGYEATRAIRAEGIGPGLLPIIALTANAFPEDIAAARAAGMQGHLAKPVVFAQLARALQRWLPTRIIEAAKPGDARSSRASTLAGSPRLVARWQERRAEAVAAVRAALSDDGVLGRAADSSTAQAAATARDHLARLAHKLAGTAAMFGEAELGACAAALEQALTRDDDLAASRKLANKLLALAESAPQSATQ
jgi:PAS domain S-box-containing protein